MSNEQDSPLDFSFVLASSVHDMKNSLGMLLNTLETVIKEAPAENTEQSKHFAVLQYEASRINSELIQLLALYRIKDQRMLVRVDESYLVDILDEQLARNDMLFQTRNLKVTVDCDPDLKWYYDGELLGGVINNILVNCARYSREQLLIQADIKDQWLEIRIADDGQGYPPAMLEATGLEPAEISFTRGSTNLGLLFARQVLELHRSGNQRGYLQLANNGPLGGGVLTMRLP